MQNSGVESEIGKSFFSFFFTIFSIFYNLVVNLYYRPEFWNLGLQCEMNACEADQDWDPEFGACSQIPQFSGVKDLGARMLCSYGQEFEESRLELS